MTADGTILVVDDDRAIRRVLDQALGRAGYEVRSTGNAATLWRWVADGEGDPSGPFDVPPRRPPPLATLSGRPAPT